MIRLLIVDDESILAHSLAKVIALEKDIEVIGCAKDVEEALQLCKEKSPHVVVMDLYMPDESGIDGSRKIKALNKAIKVIMMTGTDKTEMVVSAMHVGVDSFVKKTLLPETLAHVIRTTYQGMRVFDDEVMNHMIGYMPMPSSFHSNEINLTDREVDVLKLVVAGKENKEIAEDINLSEGSVRNVVSELLRKFDVKNRVNLVIKTISLGILDT